MIALWCVSSTLGCTTNIFPSRLRDATYVCLFAYINGAEPSTVPGVGPEC